MTVPALTRPAYDLEAGFAHLRSLEGSYRLALWPYLEHLWPVWLAWMATSPRRKTERKGLQFGGYISAFAEAAGLKVSSLYAHLPASRFIHEARLWEAQSKFPALVTVASGMDSESAATLGRALEANHTPESLEEALQAAPDLSAALEMVRGWLSEGATNSNADRKGAREAAHARLKDLAPDAPEGGRERDALIYSAWQIIPDPLARAYLTAAQTGDTSAVDDLARAVTPPTYVEWGKQYARCWVCGQHPAGSEVLDAHHVAYGGHEARRNDGGAEKFSFVDRACHIPQPFNPTVTAHSRAFSVGRDVDALVSFMEYDAIEHARYEAFIRGGA